MPRVLCLDTETTGLPPKGAAPNPETYPHIVQWSFVLVDTDAETVQEHDFILKVQGPIPTTDIHGITEGRSTQCGYSFRDVYAIFEVCLSLAELIVGHNLEFDLNMINAECMRNGLPTLPPMNQFCTMRRGKELCNIIAPQGYVKFPKLAELYERLFKQTPSNLHNSLTDVYACLRCFYSLQLKRDAPPKIVRKIKHE
jgi:DNA polymerase III epsilon subunit-like protein